jgi:hypothetical protein
MLFKILKKLCCENWDNKEYWIKDNAGIEGCWDAGMKNNAGTKPNAGITNNAVP